MFSSLYYGLDTGYDTETYLNRLNVLFFTLMTLLIPHLQDVTDLQKDRNLFYRERSAGAYSPFRVLDFTIVGYDSLQCDWSFLVHLLGLLFVWFP